MPNYYCQGSADLVNGRGARRMNVGGKAIVASVAAASLAALQPAAPHACVHAAEQIEHGPPRWPSAAATNGRCQIPRR